MANLDFEVNISNTMPQSLDVNRWESLIKAIIKENTAAAQAAAVRNAVFKGHWGYKKIGSKWQKTFIKPTGTLRRSITMEIKNSGMTGRIFSRVHYAPYVDLGTRHMSAQPFLRPAFDAQVVKIEEQFERLKKLQ